MTIGDYARGKLSLICVSAVQVETSEALAVPLLSALYLCVRHNAYVTTGKAHSAPPGSTMSHTTEYKGNCQIDTLMSKNIESKINYQTMIF